MITFRDVEEVTLTHAELVAAAFEGMMIHTNHLSKGTQILANGGTWNKHIEGRIGEYAVAKLLGEFPHNADEPDYTGDVGKLEVRTYEKDMGLGGHLMIPVYQKDHAQGKTYVLCGRPPMTHVVRVYGWTLGDQVVRDENYMTHLYKHELPNPVYGVRARDLHPMSSYRSAELAGMLL